MIAIPTRHWANGFALGKPAVSFGATLANTIASGRTNDLAFMSLTLVEPALDIDGEMCKLALLSCDRDESLPSPDLWM